MKREWIRDFSEMPFTAEEYHVAEAVTWFTDSILYYNGKDFKLEDPSDTYYFTSKKSLMENLNYTYNELEKQGVFDLAFTDEEEAPADPWLKVLEDRVEEWQDRYNEKDYILKAEIKRFKAWVGKAEEEAIIYDTEMNYNTLKSVHSAYKYAWQMLGKAKDELAAYKKAMNL